MNCLTEEEIAILSSGEYTIDKLLELIENGTDFSKYFYDINKFKDSIVELETNRYRETINILCLNNANLAEFIELDRYKYIKSQIESIDDKGIFSNLYSKTLDELSLILPRDSIKKINFELKKGNNIDTILKSYTNKCLYEFIVDLYFKDITFNVLYNLKTMLKYLVNIDEQFVPKERLFLYRQILNFSRISMEDKKRLFYEYNPNKLYIDDLYTDFYNCKIHSYNDINNCITKGSSLNKFYNKQLSYKYKLKIYELDGEDFYLYAHVSKINNNSLDFPFKKNKSNEALSISLIGKDNICTYNPSINYIVFGFDFLNPNNIIHLFNSDSYTKKLDGTTKFQRIYKAEDLLKNSYGYNEILYKKTPMDNLYPTCIICFDEIRGIDLFFARIGHLPIVKINTKKYKKSGYIEDMLENNYLDSKKAKEIEFYSIYF